MSLIGCRYTCSPHTRCSAFLEKSKVKAFTMLSVASAKSPWRGEINMLLCKVGVAACLWFFQGCDLTQQNIRGTLSHLAGGRNISEAGVLAAEPNFCADRKISALIHRDFHMDLRCDDSFATRSASVVRTSVCVPFSAQLAEVQKARAYESYAFVCLACVPRTSSGFGVFEHL